MKMLDFNALEQPTLPLRLRDADNTVVNLTYPDVDMYDRLIAMTPELEAVTKTKDAQTIKAIYKFIAELMSYNDDGFVFTAEELRDKYRMKLLDVFQLMAAYMEFIAEAQNSKN